MTHIEPGESRSFIPKGTRAIRRDDRVILWFPSENDAIIFCEILKEVQSNPTLFVRATSKGDNDDVPKNHK